MGAYASRQGERPRKEEYEQKENNKNKKGDANQEEARIVQAVGSVRTSSSKRDSKKGKGIAEGETRAAEEGK